MYTAHDRKIPSGPQRLMKTIKILSFSHRYLLSVIRNHSVILSSNGDIFRVTGPLWRESTGHRQISLTKASDAELWYFLWSALEQTVEQTNETLVIWETTSRPFGHCNVVWSFTAQYSSSGWKGCIFVHWSYRNWHRFHVIELNGHQMSYTELYLILYWYNVDIQLLIWNMSASFECYLFGKAVYISYGHL